MPAVANISCYKFAPLSDLKSLREDLLGRANALKLKGTILISPEGINVFLAGPRESIDSMVQHIRSIPGLADLAPKYSDSDHQPFRRMLVRIKKEIIAFGVDGVDPSKHTSPKLKAAELKQWLDEGRPVTLLDTRNDYEVKLGTFRHALPIGVDHFRDFPAAVRQLPPEMKDQPIVMFCTGGIRCEKAGPFMEMEGFKNIYQLDGGILKYFEEIGGDHYDGECFVFDQRVGVDPALAETDSIQCFVCQTPLSGEDQADNRYVEGKSCPFCFKTNEEQQAESLRHHQELLSKIANPLPGSVPYDNFKPLNIPERCDGMRLIDALLAIMPHVQSDYWMSEFAKDRLVNDDRASLKPDLIVRAGQRVLHRFPDNVEPSVNANIRILHEDAAIIVVDKPAPLPMHPGGRFHRNTLQWMLHEAYAPEKPRPSHRLDADTSGVVVFCRTARMAGRLQPQFAEGKVQKRYVLRVHGHPQTETFTCSAPVGVQTDGGKVRVIDESAGQDAETQFRVIRRDNDGTSLLEAIPVTGRTNQIRLHAWHCGHPIVGDPVYLTDGKMATTAETLSTESAPLCLHSAELSFVHPLTNQRVTFLSKAAFE
ncbi:MAG: sulfurtransferase [Verrucomicrobiaceae bacterium]|nr:sulfurtransferase [Verrucomicrobiaceae bacterium]